MKNTTNLLIDITSIIMICTAAVYFLAVYLNSTEDVSEHAIQVEIILFLIVGIAYVLLGIWMIRNKLNSRAPYVISIVISLALIGLYIAAKTTSMPIVGMEMGIGIVDIVSKVLQVAVVIISVILLPALKRNQNYEVHGDMK